MINLVTYGKKNGPYAGAVNRVFDCTGLPNPHGHAVLHSCTGLDPRVQVYVMDNAKAKILVDRALHFAVDGMTLAFFCVGGRHRSVSVAEAVFKRLRTQNKKVSITHREISR